MADYYSYDADYGEPGNLAGLFKKRYAPPAVTFFILWNPESDKAPTRTFLKREDAEECAKGMAKKFKGQSFYICEASAFAAVSEPPVELTALKAAKKVKR